MFWIILNPSPVKKYYLYQHT